jgi:alpha-amylase
VKKISLIIEVHQPMRLRTYRFSEIGNNSDYYDDYENEYYIKKISEECYLPLNKILLSFIYKYRRQLKLSFLFSGVVLDQFELYAPEMLESIKSLISTGCVKLLSGTYSNSFGLPAGNMEYIKQVTLLKNRIKYIFRKKTLTVPEKYISGLNPDLSGIRVFFGNRESIDNKPFGFSVNNHNRKSFTAENVLDFLNSNHRNGDMAVLYIPCTISGDYQNKWLIEFLGSLVTEIISKSDYSFADPSELSVDFLPGMQIKNEDSTNYDNLESPCIPCNDLQKDAFKKLYSLREKVELCYDLGINKDWLYLQSREHFYFMSSDLYEEKSKSWLDIPYESPYFAYLNYMNILEDFSDRLIRWNINEIRIRKINMQKWEKVLKKNPVSDLLQLQNTTG